MELDELRADNERLRWRHPSTLPEWNDLPDAVRADVVRLGEEIAGGTWGGDVMVNVYGELRKKLAAEPPQ